MAVTRAVKRAKSPPSSDGATRISHAVRRAALCAGGACAAIGAWRASAGETSPARTLVSRALGVACASGLHGAVAGVVQVLLLMWLRTAMNYQYAMGTGLRETFVRLWREGGIARFYQGISFALMQAPLTRFGDVAANEGVRHLFEHSAALAHAPPSARSLVVSLIAVGFRLAIHPLDNIKTNMQIYGPQAHARLLARVRDEGAAFLFDGCTAGTVSNFIGQYPYWYTYNLLAPRAARQPLRLALCALAATSVSDCFANTFRVLKTQKLLASQSYADVVRRILRTDGARGLLGRGLLTRMLTNAIQSVVFTLVWRSLAAWRTGRNGAES
jgi:hypothetical protein